MTPNDDIPGETPVSQSEQAERDRPAQPLRTVGPESETRGGPEAPDESFDTGGPPPAPMPDGRPGERAGLPPGSLPGPYLGPQGDENRDPPPDAPAPVGSADTV
nr:hypothetical protein [uncultured Rhodopila sp.]